MNKTILVEQKAGIGSNTNQIAEQNNYYGMTPSEASELAINLFMDNFPKLQQVAKETAENRVNDFCIEVMKKLEKENINNYDAFADPDVQYVLLDAQRNYARFGTEELLSNLSDLIIHRVKFDSDTYMKIVTDKAISVVPNLSQSQIDTLTLLFVYKNTINKNIKTISDLKNHFDLMSSLFFSCGHEGYSLLNALGCLEINLGNILDICSKKYSLDKESISEICPSSIIRLHCDYGTSHIGKLIAIINYNNKIGATLNPQDFISC